MQETKTLYRFYDKDQVLLYVGITGNFQQRKNYHKSKNAYWFFYVNNFTLEKVDHNLAAEIEKEIIQIEQPIFNNENNGLRLDTVTKQLTYLTKNSLAIYSTQNKKLAYIQDIKILELKLELSEMQMHTGQICEDSYKQGSLDSLSNIIEKITPFRHESSRLDAFLHGIEDGIKFRKEVDSLIEGKKDE
jgi:predicted GIY-YIG superfamily endonuclease